MYLTFFCFLFLKIFLNYLLKEVLYVSLNQKANLN